MSKEVDKIECETCESMYKLVYDLNETSGHPKFCAFCGSDVYNDKDDFEMDIDADA